MDEKYASQENIYHKSMQCSSKPVLLSFLPQKLSNYGFLSLLNFPKQNVSMLFKEHSVDDAVLFVVFCPTLTAVTV